MTKTCYTNGKSGTFYFGEKGRERVAVPYYSIVPENRKSILRIAEVDFTLFAWAMSMVKGEAIGIYDDIPDYDYEGWHRVLAEAEKIVSFKNFDELTKYLLTLKNSISGESELSVYVKNYGEEFWNQLEKYKRQLEEMKQWTELVLGKDEKIRVEGF